MILDEILANKRDELRERQKVVSLAELQERVAAQQPARSLADALSGDTVRVIAEVKRRSPSAGDLAANLDPATLAVVYADSGASAISVLTDRKYFSGTLDDLVVVREAVSLPVLRKDFIISEYQVLESRAFGADAVLLIVRALDSDDLSDLLDYARTLGMQALVEVHAEEELDTALDAGADVIGINNRDLAHFTTDLDVTRRLAPRVPDGHVVVSESGIRSREQIESLRRVGVHTVLVGESLVRHADPGEKLRELAGP